MNRVVSISAAILAAACNLDSTGPGTMSRAPVVVSITGVEYRSLVITLGESAQNRLSVCAPANVELFSRVTVGDSLVAKLAGTITFAPNDSANYICGENNHTDGREARLVLNGVSAGNTAVSVSIWADPKLPAPESFSVVVRAP